MTGDRFEARIADWLEEGPESAPRHLEDLALQHAATHPRTVRSELFRRAQRVRRGAAWLAAAAVIALVVGSAGLVRFGGDVAAPAPISVTGTETCLSRVPGEQLIGQETDVVLKGGVDVCQTVASDPRVTGEVTRRFEADLFGPDAQYPTGSSNYWGTAELRNADGAWSGRFVGTYRGRIGPNLEGRLSWAGIGSGAYRGLVYRATVVTDEHGTSTLTGTIEPIGEGAVVASIWCWVTSATPDLAAPSPVAHREASRSCTVTADDDRLAGTAVENRTIDRSSDGTTVDTGRLFVTSIDGDWNGTFAGTGDWYVPGLVTGELDGAIGLAGLRLSFRIVSEDGMHGVLVGEIASSVGSPR